jgi:hypothetical protein
LQTPNPLSLPKDARKRFNWILNYSRQLYARHKDEVDAEMAERYQPYRQQLDTDSEDQTQESYFG